MPLAAMFEKIDNAKCAFRHTDRSVAFLFLMAHLPQSKGDNQYQYIISEQCIKYGNCHGEE